MAVGSRSVAIAISANRAIDGAARREQVHRPRDPSRALCTQRHVPLDSVRMRRDALSRPTMRRTRPGRGPATRTISEPLCWSSHGSPGRCDRIVERGREGSAHAGGVRATRLEAAVEWAAALDWAAALAPSPLRLATSCCGMAMAQGGDFFEALGSAPPAASGRAADLLIVAGTLTRRQLPSLLELYARMVEPRWVMAWGACAISGGPYDNYATISGLSRILPVDVVVPGCPPRTAGPARRARGASLGRSEKAATRVKRRGRRSRSGGWNRAG